MDITPASARRLARLTLVSAVALSLAACVAIPVDSRTGLPVPWAQPAGPREPAGYAQALPAAPSSYTARLYPVNELANQAGMLTALVVDAQDGRGRLTLSYLGDTLSGEASRVDASHPGFGRLHQQVLGGVPVRSSGRRGIANAAGARGVSAQCEYILSGPAQGTGVCLFSDGARYQMHFG